MRGQEGRGVLRARNPSCKLRGFNGRQLARLSTVFLAFPEEDEQSVCSGRGASAAQLLRPGSRPRGRESRSGRGRLLPWDRGFQGRRGSSEGWGGGVEVGRGRGPERFARPRAGSRRGSGPRSSPHPK